MREWLSITHHLMTNHNFEKKNFLEESVLMQILCVEENKKRVDQWNAIIDF